MIHGEMNSSPTLRFRLSRRLSRRRPRPAPAVPGGACAIPRGGVPGGWAGPAATLESLALMMLLSTAPRHRRCVNGRDGVLPPRRMRGPDDPPAIGEVGYSHR